MEKMAHAIQIRTRSVELLGEGYTQEQVAKIMNVGVHSIRRWKNEIEEYGCIRSFYDVSSRKPPKLSESVVRAYFSENPDALLKEAAAYFNCDTSAVFYACNRYKITYKKTKSILRKK